MGGVAKRNKAVLLFARKIGQPKYWHRLLHATIDVCVGELVGKSIYFCENIAFIEIFL